MSPGSAAQVASDLATQTVAVPERLLALAIVFGAISFVLVAWFAYRRGARRDALIARLSARATAVYAARLERDPGAVLEIPGEKPGKRCKKRGTVSDLDDLNAILDIRPRGKEGQL